MKVEMDEWIEKIGHAMEVRGLASQDRTLFWDWLGNVRFKKERLAEERRTGIGNLTEAVAQKIWAHMDPLLEEYRGYHPVFGTWKKKQIVK